MSFRNKDKDHLRAHGGVELIEPAVAPQNDNPLMFWSGHPEENFLVDLCPFSDGEKKNPHRRGGSNWAGPFSGRSKLIRELAPAIQVRCTLASRSSCKLIVNTLRQWWRLFDAIEAVPGPDGLTMPCLESVADLNVLHEDAAHRNGLSSQVFTPFLAIANDARLLLKPRPPRLLWTAPTRCEPERMMIPEDQAKKLKIAIKQDWEGVRRTWAKHDALLEEAQRRLEIAANPAEAEAGGEIPCPIVEADEILLRNLQHFMRIQNETGSLIPETLKLTRGKTTCNFTKATGLRVVAMRAIVFPTAEEADIAFHAALMNSGWNPSTLITGIDATQPERVFEHPKDARQNVLAIEEKEITMQGNKRRAGGRTQFCMGLKKNPSSPPAIVVAYLERSVRLREQLRRDYEAARAELMRLRATEAPQEAIRRQFEQVQTLQQGMRNVWLYLERGGRISWIDGLDWRKYPSSGSRKSYLDNVIERLNAERTKRGMPPIAKVQPSDFRDIYARWVYKQTGGNILAVMFALGHANLQSTNAYIDNNIFNSETDETLRRFMTRLFQELQNGRVDLTILAQLVGQGLLTPEMQRRLEEYRRLSRSRVQVGCADPKKPPSHIALDHAEGKWCGTHRCLNDCPNARFLPESIDGIAMRVEELIAMSDHLQLETWMRGDFQEELNAGEYLLADLYPSEMVDSARGRWREKIAGGQHVVPGVGLICKEEP